MYLMYGTSQVVNCCCIQYYQTRQCLLISTSNKEVYIDTALTKPIAWVIQQCLNGYLVHICWGKTEKDWEMAAPCLLLFTVLLHTWSATGNCAANNDCPLWFIPGDNGSCECGSDLDCVVKCNNESRETYLLGCFCMSYDSTGLVVGACPYQCTHSGTTALHYSLPKHIIDLEDFLCGPLNRKGRMCGQCKDNFTTSAYSYDLRCVKCSGGHYNWAKYVALALLPPTCSILYCGSNYSNQCYTASNGCTCSHSAGHCTSTNNTCQLCTNSTNTIFSIHTSMHSLYHLWYFKSWLLSNSHSTWSNLPKNVNNTHPSLGLPILALYPLILIVITYSLIELHARNFWPLVWAWKPVQYCFTHCGIRWQWNFKSSIIEAFAIFCCYLLASCWAYHLIS